MPKQATDVASETSNSNLSLQTPSKEPACLRARSGVRLTPELENDGDGILEVEVPRGVEVALLAMDPNFHESAYGNLMEHVWSIKLAVLKGQGGLQGNFEIVETNVGLTTANGRAVVVLVSNGLLEYHVVTIWWGRQAFDVHRRHIGTLTINLVKRA